MTTRLQQKHLKAVENSVQSGEMVGNINGLRSIVRSVAQARNVSSEIIDSGYTLATGNSGFLDKVNKYDAVFLVTSFPLSAGVDEEWTAFRVSEQDVKRWANNLTDDGRWCDFWVTRNDIGRTYFFFKPNDGV